MPLQNRVNPFGDIIATPERGTMIGNRGVLVDDSKHLIRNYQVRRWICCQLHYKDIRRVVMSPNRWTELFFLDEATAFAAGHRPCFECRNPAAKAFQAAWTTAQLGACNADAMDIVLEHDRKNSGGGKKTYVAPAQNLPKGTFFTDTTDKKQAWLVLNGQRYPWTFAGYGPPQPLGTGLVTVLTPKATVATLAHGYQVGIHPSALE